MKKLLLLLLGACSLTLAAKVTVSEYDHGKVRCIKVENSYYTIIIKYIPICIRYIFNYTINTSYII